MAARWAQERRRRAPDPTRAVIVRILYDGTPEEPPLEWESYLLYLPEKAPSAEAWYNSPLVRQYRQQQSEAGGPP
jgi:hypothetical protein